MQIDSTKRWGAIAIESTQPQIVQTLLRVSMLMKTESTHSQAERIEVIVWRSA
ncbi:MAG: hypothetical protein IPM68_16660 [Flavobacteriales bacterium]|nr:hypothetical protein [Flavobacteriales bacterium]